MRRSASADGSPARPAAEARGHRDVLLAADRESHRAAHDAGAGLIGPEFLAGVLVISLELAFRRAGENKITARRQDAAHERRRRVDCPFLVAAPGVERD